VEELSTTGQSMIICNSFCPVFSGYFTSNPQKKKKVLVPTSKKQLLSVVVLEKHKIPYKMVVGLMRMFFWPLVASETS